MEKFYPKSQTNTHLLSGFPFGCIYLKKAPLQLYKIILLFFFGIAANHLTAQVSLNGVVTDSLGKPLQSVSIILKKSDGTLLAFDISTNSGFYKIQYSGAFIKDSLLIEANAIGFKKVSSSVISAVQVFNFTLFATGRELPDVIVQNNKHLLKKEGDTLNYDVASFSNKQDRTIVDIIKKLPGVEVSENGQISYGGKPINRFYIDGDNLLDGRYNIATNSIPNDMVAKIQVLENHQPLNVLKDASKSELAAMNIVLKANARLKVVGTGDLAVGSPGVYNLTANAMLFKNKVKFINYLKMNNTGVDLQYEVINHFDAENQSPPTLLSAAIGGIPDLSKKRWLFNNAALLNVNDLINLNKGLQLKINCYYLYDRQYQTSQFASSFFLPNDTIQYAEQQTGKTLQNTFNTQFTLTANRKDYYLNNVTIIDNSPTTLTAHLAATSNNNISQQLSGTITNLSNKFNIIKKSKKGNLLDFYSFINSINNPVTLNVQPGLYSSQLNNNIPYAGLIQHASVPTLFTNNHIVFSVITQKFQQNYKLGFNYQDQDLNSILESQQLAGSKALVADSFQNKLNWSRLKVYAQADYTYSSGPLVLRAYIPITYQDTKYKGRQVQQHLTNLPIAPRLSLRYNTSNESYITVNYNYTNGWANIDQVYDGYLMNNYRSFYTNGNLLNELRGHSVAAAYIHKHTLKVFFFSLGGSYTKNTNSTINDAQISSFVQQSKLIPFQHIATNSLLYGTISKYIFPLRTSLSAKISWNRSLGNQLQNGDLLRMQNEHYTGTINIYTRVGSSININYSGSYIRYSGKRINGKQTNFTAPLVEKWQHEMSTNFALSKKLYIRLSGENSVYLLPGSGNRNFTFIDAFCTYKLPKLKTEIEFSLTNLAGIDTYRTVSLASNSIIESSYLIRPRMGMVKFYFRF